MMVKVREVPVMGDIRIVDAHSFLNEHYEGELIHHADSRKPEGAPLQDRDRWAEVTLWALDDGTFLVHRAGASRVYHVGDGSCLTPSGRQAGDPATVDDLPDDAVPCDQCRPPYPQDLDDDEPVRYEFRRHTIDHVETPERAVTALTEARKRGSRSVSRVVSEPVRELLTHAVRYDPRFALPRGGGHGRPERARRSA